MVDSYIDKTINYVNKHKTSFAMPGHKRSKTLKGTMPQNLYDMISHDVTESNVLDDLNHPKGIIKEYMQIASRIYDTKQTFFLTGGSTLGILSAINYLFQEKGELIVGPDCHISVYNACNLKNVKMRHIKPYDNLHVTNNNITASELEKACKKYKKAKAVFITSPTYYGGISDIKTFAEIAHRYNKLLMVDEAHGAHLYFDNLGLSAVRYADITVQSLHKMAPALTQTALLHINKNANSIDIDDVQKSISVFQSSSPSYLLVESICWFMDNVDYFKEKIKETNKILDTFIIDLKARNIYKEVQGTFTDKYKKLIDISKFNITKSDCDRILNEVYNIEYEGFYDKYLLCYVSPFNTENDFKVLLEAIDDLIASSKAKKKTDNIKSNLVVGKKAKRDIYTVPPEIPIIREGEKITEKQKEKVDTLLTIGIQVEGLGE